MKLSNLKLKLQEKKHFSMIGFNEEDKPHIEKMLADIKIRDATFEYDVKPSKFQNTKYVAFIFNKSIDKCHQRSVWIISKHKQNTGKQLLYQAK